MFQLIQTLYWLALSTWFGGVLFIAIAAPIVFRTMREFNPTIPTILSVNLENQHGTLLAGSIVANLLGVLLWLELACAGALGLTILGQWFFVDRSGASLVSAILRTAMYAAAVGMLVYDRWFVWPKVWKFRQEYIDNADNPDVANPAKDQFDRYHAESVSVLRNVLFLLLGIILFSADIRARSGFVIPPSTPDATQSR
ncbi:MAG: hypothetical protein ACREJC_16715, partial [Tepidisphaeraceae bacterium]